MLPFANFKRRRPTKASFRFLSLLEEKEVGSRGKAPGRHPQMPKYPSAKKAQEGVNFQLR